MGIVLKSGGPTLLNQSLKASFRNREEDSVEMVCRRRRSGRSPLIYIRVGGVWEKG